MKIFRLFTITLSLLMFGALAFAQTGVIRGFVYDKSNGEPIIFTNVFLSGTSIGAQTDVNGFYQISKIKPGDYTLQVTYLGYDTLRMPVTVVAGEMLTRKLYLSAKAVNLNEVDISAERQEAKSDVRVSITKIGAKEIKQVAAIGGEADIAQYIQTLPGVISTGDQGGQLYIRGGAPIQSKVLMDGMVIYNPFHSIGFYSVFDADVIRNAEIFTGGMPAEHGGRISSVIDITTRDGNQKRFGGKLSSSPFMSKLLLEGPLKKAVKEGDPSSSFLFSARTSYLQQTSKIFYNYIDAPTSTPIPYNFRDLYGKMSFNTQSGSKFNVFGFNFTDSVQFNSNSNMSWTNNGLGGSFVIIPGTTPALINGSAAYSNYEVTLLEKNRLPRNSSIGGFNMALGFTYFYGKDELKYGIDMQAFKTAFNFTTVEGSKVDLPGSSTELVGYIKYKKVWDRLVIEPGLHARYYANLGEPSLEPRFGAKWNVSDRFRMKLASGLFSQNLISANSDQQVVNLFYGFLTAPDNLPSTFDGKPINSRLQKARHIIIGTEFDIAKNIELNVEGYIKDFYLLINLNRDKVFPVDKDFVYENGQARGVDFTLKYEHKRSYLWLAYSLAEVVRNYEVNGGLLEYNPNFDRRHNVTVIASQVVGKKSQWEFNAKWNLGSGFPFTPTAGYFEQQNLGGGYGSNTNTTPGTLAYQLGDIYSKRFPWFHRFDITVKRRWEISERSHIEANISITNVYNRKNIFYIDRVTADRINQLPFLPSVGVNWTF